MSRKQLLFVIYHDEKFEEGFSYAIDLAKTMNNDMSILMLYKRKAMERFEDMMTVVTFAEEGEHTTAREMIMEDYKKNNEDYDGKMAVITEKCRNAGVTADVSATSMDAVSAVKNFLRQNTRIDMVLLSPSVTNDGNINSKTLNRLVKTASRPIVTMARQVSAA